MIIAHIDMDCFFCSCEEKKDPSLKGKPVLVGSTGERGVISAANYEARDFGVYSATPISKARALCPNGVFLPVDFDYYREQSKLVMDIFKEVSDSMVQVSIDEAYLDLTTYSQKFKTWKSMAISIKNKVKKQTQLTCSIGISKSKLASKIASDFNKPDGITIVKNIKSFLAPLPIEKIPGIGKVTKEYYFNNYIFKISDLQKLDRYITLSKFGERGLHLLDIVNGKESTKLYTQTKRKSISNERTFHTDESDQKIILRKLKELCHLVHEHLKNRSFKTVGIKIRYSDFSTITKDCTLLASTNSLREIKINVLKLYKQTQKGKLRLIGVRLSNITDDKQTILEEF